MTSLPLDGAPGADTGIARDLIRHLPDVDFLWFGRRRARGPGQQADGRIPVFGKMPGGATRLQIALAGLAAESRVDLVHAVLTVGPGFARYAALRSRLPDRARRPVVHTVPGIVEGSAIGGDANLGTTIALSEATADRLRRAGVTDVAVIPPGIDLARWPFAPQSRSAVPTLLFAGHAEPDSGIDEALQIAAELTSSGVALRLVCALRPRVGQRLDVVLAALSARAQRLGIDAQFHGTVADFAAMVAGADVFLFPVANLRGKADVPIVVLEAMATGRPVVAFDQATYTALGTDVVRVPSGDISAAATAVADLLDDPDAFDSVVMRARSRVEVTFDIRDMADAYRAVYRQVLDRRGQEPARVTSSTR